MIRKVNALTVRQHFGEVLKELEAGQEPIIVEKGRKEVAVLITIDLFRKRFVDFQDLEARQKLFEAFKNNPARCKVDSLSILRDLRYG
ncbi:MAG TPA: type II toxin-antitoxin system Phd/YefM family antitoxin [Myxococcota bacterium]|nr:type II toxin-antitoxin system Phd/YefM family antitoxin [Myxococcota bacterium]